MKLITKLNPSLCPRTCELLALMLLNAEQEGKDVVVFHGMLYTYATDGIYHCAPLYKDEPYVNTWTDEQLIDVNIKRHAEINIRRDSCEW